MIPAELVYLLGYIGFTLLIVGLIVLGYLVVIVIPLLLFSGLVYLIIRFIKAILKSK